MVKFKETVVPNMDNHKKYKFFIDQYEGTYSRLKDSAYTMSTHISNSNK